MDLLQLQYFRTIAHLENLTKASKLLFVAQSNLSVSLTKLEEELGVSLFERRKGKITLTANGRLFLEHVEQVLDELSSGIDHVRNIDIIGKDRIRIAGSIVDLIADIILQFYPENRNVSLRQINCNNSEIPAKVLSGEVDFGFVYGTLSMPGLEYMFLDSCERGIIVHTGHPLATPNQKISIKEFSFERLICSMSRDDDVFLKELAPLTGFHPKVYFECDSMEIETSLITSGAGIMFAPLAHYLKLMRAKPGLPLSFIRIKEQLPESQIGVVRRSGNILTDAALEFFKHIDSFFKSEAAVVKNYYDMLPG